LDFEKRKKKRILKLRFSLDELSLIYMPLALLINFKLSWAWYSRYLHAQNAVKPWPSIHQSFLSYSTGNDVVMCSLLWTAARRPWLSARRNTILMSLLVSYLNFYNDWKKNNNLTLWRPLLPYGYSF